MLQRGPERTQSRGTKQDAGDQLAHHGWLANSFHQLAHQPPADEQYDDLAQESHLRGPA